MSAEARSIEGKAVKPSPSARMRLAAKVLIVRYGDQAGLEAAKWADEMLERGNMKRRAIWLQVMQAIDELQAEEPVGTVH